MRHLARLPLVRHARYLYYRWQLDNHIVFAASYYVGTADADAWLTAIWRGEA